MPRADIREDDNKYVVELDLPGLSKNDVEVTFDNNTLTVSGERKLEDDKKEGKVHRRERFWGKFVRSLTLPTNVDRNKIDATFRDGVLTITLPKAEEAKVHRVEVK